MTKKEKHQLFPNNILNEARCLHWQRMVFRDIAKGFGLTDKITKMKSIRNLTGMARDMNLHKPLEASTCIACKTES